MYDERLYFNSDCASGYVTFRPVSQATACQRYKGKALHALPIMVKFQKQLAVQIVPEWKEGYCGYKQLKKDVKRIKEWMEDERIHPVKNNKSSKVTDSAAAANPLGLIDSWKSFARPLLAISDKLVNNSRFLWVERLNNITVHFRQLRQTIDKENVQETEIYETKLLHSSIIPAELALQFFGKLDAELNRVNGFFELKEEEYTLRAHALQLQMANLLELRKVLARARQDAALAKVSHISSQGDDSSNKNNNKPAEIMLDIWSLQSVQEVAMSKKQVQHAEKLLRSAFADFYRGLGLLKNYCTINIMAFSKILKKYDKVTGWNTSPTYMRAVETSYFATSSKVVKLMDGVEHIFTLHLAKKNHRETMIYLRPEQNTSRKFTSYFQGVFTGCSVAFVSVLLLKLTVSPSSSSSVDPQTDANAENTEALFYVSSLVGLVLLHLYMYAWNVCLWRGARINYTLIFEWAPGTELQYQQVLLLSTGLTSLWMLTLILVKLCSTLPYANLAPFLVLLVKLADNFLADQLTSQVTAFKHIPFFTCHYFGERLFKTPAEKACNTDCPIFRYCQILFAVLPSWWRLMQCARRWKDEGDIQQLLNAGKYLSALVAAAVRVAYAHYESRVWLILYVTSSLASSVFGVYWDIIRDWGLMQYKSVNPWLRDHLILEQKRVYYISMIHAIVYFDETFDHNIWQVVNIVLRTAWLFALVMEETSGISRRTMDLAVAALEVFRRGHWNFYRLEHEHLHKFGDFKALTQMPLKAHDFGLQLSKP
ncbi:hypothetical protein R1flu_018632 [Riccia fluitans]|uniref:Phosphate transporter PHO1 n=1 Tax=Riccia fluitans TaxID=41844 RepID=A0ABD1ZGF3_9MARC